MDDIALHSIADVFGKIAPNGSWKGFSGIRRSHYFTVLQDGVLSFKNESQQGPACDKRDEPFEEVLALMNGIKPLGIATAQKNHFSSRHLQPCLLEASKNGSDEVFFYSIRLHHRQRTFADHNPSKKEEG